MFLLFKAEYPESLAGAGGNPEVVLLPTSYLNPEALAPVIKSLESLKAYTMELPAPEVIMATEEASAYLRKVLNKKSESDKGGRTVRQLIYAGMPQLVQLTDKAVQDLQADDDNLDRAVSRESAVLIVSPQTVAVRSRIRHSDETVGTCMHYHAVDASRHEGPAPSVTDVKVTPVSTGSAKLRAIASVVIGDHLQCKGLRVLDGVNGLFVGYPVDPNHNGDDYKSILFPVTVALRDAIEEAVLTQYHKIMEAK